jgi:glycerol kinase
MPSKKYVGAIDQGTTSTRFILFNQSGETVVSHQLEQKQIFPQAGWVEHDAQEIWKNTGEVIRTALEKANINPLEIASIGITNQRETTVVWNKKTGKPYQNAIVWQDTRTAEICEKLTQDGGQRRFAPKTGLPLATYFSGPKIKWILDHFPEVRKDALKGDALFGNMDTWIIWQLSGGIDRGIHITDVTNASRTMLMNLETLEWEEEMLSIFGIPRAMLPQIRSSSEVYGVTSKTGPFGCEIPIAGDLGDQHAALFGQACFSPGEAKNTYGTGCFLLLNTGEKSVESKNGLLTTLAYKIGKEKACYALEGSVAIAGALVQWIRDNLGLIKTAPEIDILAQSVSDNGGVYFVPAFSGLFAPYWQSDARGIIAGLTRYVNKGHLARAVLEATAFQTKEVFDAMQKDSKIALNSLKVDGGMTASGLLMQFQSDLLNVPVFLPKVAETTALGASYAAGLAVGFWKNKEELRQNWKLSKEWKPKMPMKESKKLYQYWLKAVQKSMNWVEK